jgi:hypothetical protein
VIDIVAQAVLARFIDQGNNLAHLAKSLSSGSINGLKINDTNVKQVMQPYGSNGGKLPEQADALITRVSERLRHKQRSITIWDYEHLVLEAFPGIYKVKCLNHTALPLNAGSGTDWEIAPGHVTVICIPDVRNRNAVNPFEPKTSVRTLTEVKNYLMKYTSPWVDLRIANPVYEQLSISCKVGFAVGKDPGYYTSQLEVALQQYLSPWAFDLQDDIIFGGSVHRSHIIRFIEQQDYVDFVINFKMSHTSRDGKEDDLSEAKAKTSRSIIVSAQHHDIQSGDATCPDCRRLASSTAIVDTKECCSNPCCKN